MRKILVPIDFSEPSVDALEVAAAIARERGASLVLLHMLGLSEAILTKNEAQEYEEAMYYMKLAQKRFKDFMNKPFLKGLDVYQIVQNYKIFSEINNVAREQGAELIVMGSHGTSGVGDIFVGSNTEKVVRSSEIPVLVIKEADPNFKIKKMLFACNFDNLLGLAYKNVKAFAESFSAELELIYINTPYRFKSTSEVKERIDSFLFKVGEQGQKVKIYNDYSVEGGLFNYAKKQNSDVIAIATHGRKGLSHFFLGSIGEDLANHANIPVLTFRI
ncbi:MAG: universal stress protein [Flavobacteriaceae bacterium]